jgi:hypothetical protein
LKTAKNIIFLNKNSIFSFFAAAAGGGADVTARRGAGVDPDGRAAENISDISNIILNYSYACGILS